MSGPLIFISHSTARPGKADTYRSHVKEATDLIESEEPRMIAFNSYASEDGTDVSTVQVHPDADSLDVHLRLFAERLGERAFEAVDTSEINIYGKPSEAALEMLAGLSQGMRVRVYPAHEGGFLRPQPL